MVEYLMVHVYLLVDDGITFWSVFVDICSTYIYQLLKEREKKNDR